jgi:thioredoxin-dependent peroxiredoxin
MKPLFLALVCCISLALALEAGQTVALPKQVTDSFGQVQKLEKTTWKVFFFYPRVGTSGCTAQNIEYTKLYPEFLKRSAQVFGVSSDDAKSQCAFVANSQLKVPQLPNGGAGLAKTFAVGNTFGMLSRDTVVVAPNAQVVLIRRGVNAVSDAQEVLAFLKTQNCKALTSGTNQCKP